MLSDAIACTFAASMSVAITRAPAAAKASAVARPMPCPAAVTKAVLLASCPGMACLRYELSAFSGRPDECVPSPRSRVPGPGGIENTAWLNPASASAATRCVRSAAGADERGLPDHLGGDEGAFVGADEHQMAAVVGQVVGIRRLEVPRMRDIGLN